MLAAAAELIVERGLDGTSLRSVGQRAGVSRAMPGYHFGSKDGLIERLARRGHERTLDAALGALATADRDALALTSLEALRVMIESFLDVVLRGEAPEERAVVVLWGATFPAASRLDAMLESDRETHGLLADQIRAGHGDGSIRSDLDPDAAALMVMGLARGAAALAFTHPDLADTARIGATCGEAIVAALTPRPEAAPG